MKSGCGQWIFGCLRWLVWLAVMGILAGTLSQAQTQEGPGSQPPMPDAESPANSVRPANYVTDLNTGQLLDMDNSPGWMWLYGGSISDIYFSSHNNQGERFRQNFTAANPFAGFTGHTENAEYVFQYSPALAYIPAQGSFDAFHNMSFNSNYTLNQSWSWNTSVMGQYGNLMASEFGSGEFFALGSVSAFNPELALFGLTAGNTAVGSASTGLTWQRNETQTFSLSLGHSYYEFLAGSNRPSDEAFLLRGEPGHTNMSSGSLAFSDSLSPQVSVNVGANIYRIWERRPCNYYDGFAGLNITINPQTTLAVSGGPEWSSAACGGATSYTASGDLSSRLTPTTTAYVSAQRLVTPTYLGLSGWQDVASAGIAKGITPRTGVSFNFGYLRNSFVEASGHFQGYFAGGSFQLRLTGSLSLGMGYNQFYETAGAERLNAGMAMLTLTWNPLPENFSLRRMHHLPMQRR